MEIIAQLFYLLKTTKLVTKTLKLQQWGKILVIDIGVKDKLVHVNMKNQFNEPIEWGQIEHN